MRVPNFIIGGSSASGTSFLYELLIQHREIYLPKQRIPEPHYYYKSWEYAKGIKWYLNHYFSEATDDKIAIGERSSSYLYGGREVARRISKDFPKMKFIFMLRNPIQRAWANYRFTALQGLESVSFKEAILNEKQRIEDTQGIWREIAPYDYTGRGFYAKQLTEFLEFFPKEQILCIKSESLTNANLSLLPKIYEFLGLKTQDFIPSYAPNHTSLSVVDVKLQKELRAYFGDKSFMQFINSVRKEEAMSENKEQRQRFLQLKNNIKEIKESIPQDCVELLQEVFSEDIKLLANLVDFDVSDWLSPISTSAGGGGK